MKVKTALDAGLLRLRRLEAAVAWIDVTFEHDFGVGNGQCINRAGLYQMNGRALNGARHTHFIAALGQDYIIETGAGHQRAGRRQTEIHRSEEHTSELQSRLHIVCRLLLEKKNQFKENIINGVERPVKAAELLAFTLRVRAGNTDVLTDAEENVHQKLRAEGVM